MDAIVSQCSLVKSAPLRALIFVVDLQNIVMRIIKILVFSLFHLQCFAMHMCKLYIVVYHNCLLCCSIIIIIITLVPMQSSILLTHHH